MIHKSVRKIRADVDRIAARRVGDLIITVEDCDAAQFSLRPQVPHTRKRQTGQAWGVTEWDG